MINKKLFLLLPFLILFLIGCEINQSKSGSGSDSGSGNTTPDQPAHGQATINLLEMDVFNGDKLNTAYFALLEAYCKAGPTKLIIADMALVPGHVSNSIAPASVGVQMYALASTYAGVFASHFDIGELVWFYENQDLIYAWWDRYIQRILSIMKAAPQTTALIVINDEPDYCGARLGNAIQSNLSSVGNRVELGDVLWEWRKIRSK